MGISVKPIVDYAIRKPLKALSETRFLKHVEKQYRNDNVKFISGIGVTSIVVKDGFGINVEAENAVELAKAMKEFFFNKEKCVEMGRNARKIAEKEFDREVSYEKIVKMIDGLLK